MTIAEHTKVGIVGTGVMGSAMAKNLRAAGHDVFGYDPAPTAQQRFREMGGFVAPSPRAVAMQCQIILFSLPSAEALADAVGGENGVARAGTGTIVVECSTLPLEIKRAAFDVLALSGQIMLDCPVSGTGAQAARKDLVIFGSGDREAFQQSLPVLAGMSRLQRYLGPFGNGSVMKYIANLLVSIHNVAAAEAMVLGMKAGLDPATLYENSGRQCRHLTHVRGARPAHARPAVRSGDRHHSHAFEGRRNHHRLRQWAALSHAPIRSRGAALLHPRGAGFRDAGHRLGLCRHGGDGRPRSRRSR